MRDHAHLLQHVQHIVLDAFRLVPRLQAALQLRVMRGDAGGAGVLVALQCLDAAQGEHEAARAGDEVRTHAQRPGDVGGVDQLAGGDHADALVQAVFVQLVDQQRQGLAQRQADRVDQRHGGGAGPAFGAVHGDEVGRGLPALGTHGLQQAVQHGRRPDHRLDADRLAGDRAYAVYHGDQFAVVAYVRVTIGTERILSRSDAADARDLVVHLGARQDAALARFGALAELDLEHAHLRDGGDLVQPVVAQLAVQIAHSVLGGADLEHEVAAAFQVIGRQSAFAGIHPAARLLGTHRQRPYRGFGDGPVAHPRDVEQRGRGIRLFALRADGKRLGRHRVLAQRGKRGIHEQHAAGALQVAGGAEGDRVVDVLGRTVDPGALGAVERQFLAVHGEEVLAEELAQVFEEVTEAPYDGIVAADRVLRLGDVHDVGHQRPQRDAAEQKDEQRRGQFETGQQELPEFFRHLLHAFLLRCLSL